ERRFGASPSSLLGRRLPPPPASRRERERPSLSHPPPRWEPTVVPRAPARPRSFGSRAGSERLRLHRPRAARSRPRAPGGGAAPAAVALTCHRTRRRSPGPTPTEVGSRPPLLSVPPPAL